MKVEITKDFEVRLVGMDFEQACHLASMIQGANLEERRLFHDVLRQLQEEGIDRLME